MRSLSFFLAGVFIVPAAALLYAYWAMRGPVEQLGPWDAE